VYCDQCGARALADSVFCRACGTKLERDAARDPYETRRGHALDIIDVEGDLQVGPGSFIDWAAPLRVDSGIATFAGSEANLVRRPFTVALLTLATFGLYTIVWFYHARRFAEVRLGRPNRAALFTALLVVPVVNVIAALMTADLLARALDSSGSKRLKFLLATVATFALIAFAALPYPWWALVFLAFVPLTLMHADVVAEIVAGSVIKKRALSISALQTSLAAAGLLLVILACANLIVGATPLGYTVSVGTILIALVSLRGFAAMRAWRAVEKPTPGDHFAAANG